MSQLFKNAAVSALTAPIGAADTSFTVNITQADLFPAANTGTDPVNTAGKDWFKAALEDVNGNIEIVYVRTRTLGSATMSNVLRGQESTTALSFATGSVVELRLTSLDLQDPISLAAQATTPGKDLLWAATVDAQVQKLGSALQKRLTEAFATSGTSTAYTITPTPAITVYSEYLSFYVKFHASSGDDPTLQVSGLATPPNLVKQLTDGTYANIKNGDIPINHRSRVTLLSATQALVERLPASYDNDYKASVRAATTANITTLAGGAPNTLDGVTLAANDRILVKDQTTGSQNGLYVVTTLGTGANGTWTRTTDADGVGELTSGAIVAVEEGTTNADTQWMLTTDGTITIGTTALTWTRKDGSTSVQIQPIATPTLSANAMTLPAVQFTLDFRSATLGAGGRTQVTDTPAALTIPAGATLGTVNGVQSTIVDIVMNNGGTLERAVVNLAGGVDLSEEGLISTTAISAGATAANVVYSNTARANLPYRVVGKYVSTQTTAGQWAAAPSLVQGQGGQALAAMSSLGYGQTWQGVTRNSGTTYYNTTGKPIILMWTGSTNSGAILRVGGIDIGRTFDNTGQGYAPILGIIPPGQGYSLTITGTTQYCSELR